SDVYALGAVLYEILCLEPPVEKKGGMTDILVQVVQGKLIRPEQRTATGHTRRIPKELSAIAMKALARDKQDRYPSVEAMRQDVERYLEGRSVSAKSDTKWEMFVKFVKRNKVVSAAV